MKNKEKYFDDIVEAFIGGNGVNGICDFKEWHILKPKNCVKISCNECDKRTREWLEEEYKEPIKLTEDEKVILKNVDKQYTYIARDKSKNLYVYSEKPLKQGSECITLYGNCCELAFSHLFQFISWEDKEPYLIEDLLRESETEE